jgi:sulfane dehydrogenase subunit SoxC
VQQTHGLLSGVLWTGVLASTLIDEAGMDPKAAWVSFEGADAAAHARSISAREGHGRRDHRLRDERRAPAPGKTAIRCGLVLPGWEGNTSIKWLRRIKVGDQPWHLRSETARYTDPMPEGKWRQFSMVMETKSVITSPVAAARTSSAPGSTR